MELWSYRGSNVTQRTITIIPVRPWSVLIYNNLRHVPRVATTIQNRDNGFNQINVYIYGFGRKHVVFSTVLLRFRNSAVA